MNEDFSEFLSSGIKIAPWWKTRQPKSQTLRMAVVMGLHTSSSKADVTFVQIVLAVDEVVTLFICKLSERVLICFSFL